MKRKLLVLAVAVASLALPLTASAVPDGGTLITGGGIAQNNNSGGGDLLGIGGFTAKDFGKGVKGQIQVKTVDAVARTLVSQLHGTVVCIAETTGVVAGGQGWEIRFQVTKSSGPGAALVAVGDHGSIFVQDNPGGVDMVDESFDDLGNPECGDNDDDVGWEPLLFGNIHVRS